ncbi:MAG: DUF512 domain-containing protein [Chitinispirillales bacterium]|jgi:putative radical SAM enzyme (TIGR03279 family)|nr:DUF512 domain-containing protein [Chitinispirillales bacterium]
MNKKNRSDHAKTGLKIRSLPQDSFLFLSGLRSFDRIVSVNDHVLNDELDFYYHCAQQNLLIEIERAGRRGVVELQREPGSSLKIDFYEKPINRCANRCVFCFIDQMPPGLRRSLYIKDEDLKHSFLNGNYVTLTSASRDDLRRIVSIGLSPLFISVHATDAKVRAVMLGNKRAPDIREQMAFLSGNGISFHTQVVLCPGLNDGDVLDRTITDLFSYGGHLLSAAVVPLGVTRFRKRPLDEVDKKRALDVCLKLGKISENAAAKDGFRKLFVADEFFIKAGLPIPPASYYEDYPQIENGVGLVRQLLLESAGVKRKLRGCEIRDNRKKKNTLVITGYSALPYVKKVLTDISPYTIKKFEVLAVENRYFGNSVTVAGLLCARDVIRQIKNALSADVEFSEVILPKVMFNHTGHTLDGYSAGRISKAAGIPVRVCETIMQCTNHDV